MKLVRHFVGHDRKYGVLVYTFPSQKRSIKQTGVKQRHFLHFPPLIFKISYTKTENFYKLYSLYCGWIPSEEISPQDKVYNIPLPNISCGKVCLKTKKSKTLEEIVESTINKFWNSPFAGDIPHEWKEATDWTQYFKVPETKPERYSQTVLETLESLEKWKL